MKKIAGLFMLMVAMTFVSQSVKAQDEVEASVSADVVSQYIWRGQDYSKASLQPTLGLAYKGLELSAWGSVGLVHPNDMREIDLQLSYTVGNFKVGIVDYWATVDNDGYKYFDYAAHTTGHTFEASLGYDFGPVAVSWNTIFAGYDGVNKDGKRAYSSYIELTAPFKLGGCDWNAAVGAVPYTTDYYQNANGFAVINASLRATKEIRITDSFSLPVFGEIDCNPSTEQAHFVFGVTLQP